MKNYGCTYLLTTSHSHKTNISKLGNKKVILKQRNTVKGKRTLKNAPLHGQF